MHPTGECDGYGNWQFLGSRWRHWQLPNRPRLLGCRASRSKTQMKAERRTGDEAERGEVDHVIHHSGVYSYFHYTILISVMIDTSWKLLVDTEAAECLTKNCCLSVCLGQSANQFRRCYGDMTSHQMRLIQTILIKVLSRVVVLYSVTVEYLNVLATEGPRPKLKKCLVMKFNWEIFTCKQFMKYELFRQCAYLKYNQWLVIRYRPNLRRLCSSSRSLTYIKCVTRCSHPGHVC